MTESTQATAGTRPQEKQKRGGRRRKPKQTRIPGISRVRPSVLMAAGTVVSRATGLLRTVLQAGALGTGLLATTYNQANVVPASLYFLLIGGALNSVLVPQLVRARLEHADGGRAFEQRLVTLTMSVLGVGTLLAVWAAPQIISVYQSDTPETHEAFQLTVVFARFLLPQIFFYGLFSILGQVLNARGKFGAMMWTPVLNNIILIGMFGAYVGLMAVPDTVQDITSTQVTLLGAGTTLALAVQALSLVPFARAAGFRFRPRFDWRGTGLGKSISAARWTLLFVLANLAASTVVTRYASAADTELPTAGVGFSSYTYANTIFSLPQSVVTVSLVTALLPQMSRAVAEHRLDDLRGDLSRALRTSGVIIVPAAFFFAALGPELAQVIFTHGPAADPQSVVPLGQMLQAFGLGLIPFSAQYMLLRGFYAFEDTRTPFWMALWISAANIALATGCHLLLPPRWSVVGLAGAYALSYALGLLLTAWRLRRRLEGRLDGRQVAVTYGKLTAASLVAGAAGWAVARVCSDAVPAGWAPAVSLVAGGAAMLLVFVLLAKAMRVEELRSLPGLGRRRAQA
ncbi:murein biosynthesis integral membrane protein MurJ [Streptomyces sp. NPDC021093]|uniref:murein biosynthesis integral membrane protein MurJ n=1 Tax=Streptomyces sp. NPDC021093 TaxID=3365112 RepID=UPI0037909AB9